jgi:hypothetical protein
MVQPPRPPAPPSADAHARRPARLAAGCWLRWLLARSPLPTAVWRRADEVVERHAGPQPSEWQGETR